MQEKLLLYHNVTNTPSVLVLRCRDKPHFLNKDEVMFRKPLSNSSLSSPQRIPKKEEGDTRKLPLILQTMQSFPDSLSYT